MEIDIKTKKKQRELVGMNEMESALQGVKNMRLVIDASRKKYVRDLIGDNKDDSLRFQEILLSLIRERKELPQGDEVDSLITRTIEIMTS